MRPRADGVGDTMCHARRCRDASKRPDRSSAFPLQRSKNRVAQRSRGYLAAQANAIADRHINRGVRRRRLSRSRSANKLGRTRTDLPSENDVRNAIERVTVSATRIEIVLNESIVGEGQDRVLTLPWTRASSRRRREIIQGVDEAQRPLASHANKGARRFRQGAARRSSLARRTSVDPAQTIESLAVREHKSERSIRMTLSLAFRLPRPGGSRNGGSPSARVQRQAPDRAADALVRAMARIGTARADSGSGRTRLIGIAVFDSLPTLNLASVQPSAPAASIVAARETEFCRQRLAGEFGRRTRENGRNSVRRPRRSSLTDGNCVDFCRPGNRVGLPGLRGGQYLEQIADHTPMHCGI